MNTSRSSAGLRPGRAACLREPLSEGHINRSDDHFAALEHAANELFFANLKAAHAPAPRRLTESMEHNRQVIAAIPAHEQSLINHLLFLLLVKMPENLVFFLELARLMAGAPRQVTPERALPIDCSFFEAPADLVLRLCDVPVGLLVADVKDILHGRRSLLNRLTRFDQPRLLYCLEQMLRHQYLLAHPLNVPTLRLDQHHFLGRLLYDLGCSKFFIVERAHMSSTSVEKFDPERFQTVKSTMRRHKYFHEKCMADPQRAQLVMFLIELYNLSCRIIDGRDAFSSVMLTRDTPAEINEALAAGVYKCTRQMLFCEPMKTLLKLAEQPDIFPGYTEFHYVLEIYLLRHAATAVCRACRSPFLVFSEDYVKPQHHERIPVCPSCGHDRYAIMQHPRPTADRPVAQ